MKKEHTYRKQSPAHVFLHVLIVKWHNLYKILQCCNFELPSNKKRKEEKKKKSQNPNKISVGLVEVEPKIPDIPPSPSSKFMELVFIHSALMITFL